MHEFRSHTCGELRDSHVSQTVKISGWVQRIHDKGGVLFFPMRDHYGVTQVVIEASDPNFALAETVRNEWVICVEGVVEKRDRAKINKDLDTGDIEVRVKKLTILSKADTLPMPVYGEKEYPEDIRLTNRFLDLRRDTIHGNIVKRSQIITYLRNAMIEQGFMEYQTPILTAASPEGARDFLVPSRVHPGKFYALPQAPQQFKQLIMMAGFDKYFQIAPCFRDEDARADRSPGEFYQLDMEMSFCTQEDVFQVMEPVLHDVFQMYSDGWTVTKEFPRIPYDEAIRKYGCDKPDLRNPIEMESVTEHFRGSGFKIFAGMIEKDDQVEVWAIPAKGGGQRTFCDRMNSWAQGEGQPGLGYMFFRDGGEGAGPIAKNIGKERTAAIAKQFGLGDGDAVFFAAGRPSKIASFAGDARTRVGEQLDLIEKDCFKFCWIVDFPMYEYDEDAKKLDFSHNPFSMPQGGMEALETMDPLDIKGWQYDIVCNGIELSSGAIRNHRPDIMLKAFDLVGYDKDFVETNFSGMFNALKYGAPPHGGIAPGIDRIVMMLCKEPNIREVTMFPLNQQAQDLLLGAPAEATNAQLRELHLRLNLPKDKA